ncbi:MAG TPA: HAMP domain-containing sensor histidine kinase [Candidatus Acidoferrum sp.]|nr:HAMP domain-containing sensor histidine kinase [Candidatus Acidoferrum sp.]
MKLSRSSLLILCAWTVFIGGYAAVSLLLPRGQALSTISDLTEAFVALFANSCVLLNAASPYRRRNTFWMLLGLGCALWLGGQLVWIYEDLVRHHNVHSPFPGDMLFFLHTIPFMAALAILPHLRKMRETLRYGLVDLSLLAIFWLYIYIFVALPWKDARPMPALFNQRDLQVYMIENLLVVVGFGVLFFTSRGGWRVVYGNLFGATALYAVGYLVAHQLVASSQAYSGSLFALPFIGTFVWLGTTGILARGRNLDPQPAEAKIRRDNQWPLRLSMSALLIALPLAYWAVFISSAPQPVRMFRLGATLATLFIAASVVFFRQQLVYRERTALVQELRESLANVNRLQTHFVQSEKLASLGQLAAGAAHEINNPLTAILGYADVLIGENASGGRPHAIAQKIREQARRTKDLVNNLLSFARQVPAEKQLLDLNTILASAVQLRYLDLREKNIRIDLENRTVLPAVRGDPNQLLQVFYHLITNAVDAMETVGGGSLTIRAFRERGFVIVEFSDTGPGLQNPDKVFDPFYTTKPVGKGTGLGLSICYGVLQEHGGRISGFNRAEGGCTFRLELPAVLAVFPQLSPPQYATSATTPGQKGPDGSPQSAAPGGAGSTTSNSSTSSAQTTRITRSS